jgi:DNA-binding response OmpR family regulator
VRVLHVENNPATAKEVELMLRGVADHYETTALGEYALHLAQRTAFDLILLDVMLPDIDGYEVIRSLRAAGVRTPYLILSGLVDRESEFGALALGGGDYLAKPFTRTELFASIEAVLAHANLADPANLEVDRPGRAAAEGGDDERRKHRRFRTIKSARIDFAQGIDCRILDMSHSGAAIRIPDEKIDLPPSFLLELDGETAQLCSIRWRVRDRVGVKFLGRSW